ncbi:MAG: ferrous iron transporter B [Clostridia bacterium]|nr:ferrous iron transporter B [Clostridia bacterium]
MGLTKNSHKSTLLQDATGLKSNHRDITVALAGNPNVGKSTVFNALTGMHQHTGNWSGKTVSTAKGSYIYLGRKIILIDIPGTYSLNANSAEEEVARDFILDGKANVTVVVCDAATLQRNIALLLQINQTNNKTILCINFIDEAKKRGITVNTEKMSKMLGLPVVAVSGKKKLGLNTLSDEIIKMHALILPEQKTTKTVDFSATQINARAKVICDACVTKGENKGFLKDRKLDKILTGKLTAAPTMLLLLAVTFWLTISAANYPSDILANILFSFEKVLYNFLEKIGFHANLCNLLTYGVYRVVAWIVSVMLPPMAIFFPLFSILEDSGYLPRIAFNLDKCFKKCRACGKQSLTMCMGFGCNAAGIIGCRIIDSKRERLIAILTNSLVPCNGRFPLLLGIISMFFVVGEGLDTLKAALILTCFILLSILMTFICSFLLSKTVLKGMPTSFILELPPYRKPQIFKTIIHSVFDRTLFVLGRAVIAAIPAGLIIWLSANIFINGQTLLSICASFLDPFGKILGLDGVILIAFILGLPANEIVLPLIFLAYSGGSLLTDIGDLTIIKNLFLENGWSIITALNVMLFSLFHWPCATSLLTIKKETGSFKWTFVAFLMPTVIGIILCFVTNLIYNLII